MKVEEFIDYSEMLKIVFEISEESKEVTSFDYVCTENNKGIENSERLGEIIKNNIKELSSLQETDDPDILQLTINGTIILNVSKSTGHITSVNKLTSFETRTLAQGKTEKMPFSREHKTDFTPRTDLHTHYAGALTTASLIKIGKKHGIPYPAKWLKEMGVDVTKYNIDEKGNIRVVELNDNDMHTLEDNLKISTITQETYNRMHDVYQLRKPFTQDLSLFPEYLRELAEGYKQMGVEYAELSMTNFTYYTDKQDPGPKYMQMIEKYLPEIERETGVKMRFLAAIGRRADREWNLDEIDRMKTIAKSPYIVGMDVMSQELNSTKVFAEELQTMARYAMEEDPEFVIRVHAGENPIFPKNVRDTLQIIYDEHAKMEEITGRKLPMPKVRIGHGLYGVTDEVLSLAKEMDAIIEFNISSNLALNHIDNIGQIPIKQYLDYGVQVVLGTDGHGTYSTSPQQEAILAMAAGVKPEDFEKLKETETRIIENARAREEKHTPITDVQGLYDQITYSTPDGKKRFTKEVEEKYRMERKHTIAELKDKITAIGASIDEQEIIEATDGKIPIVLTGASKNNWPNIEPKDQHRIAVMMQVLADILDTEKTYVVTGGTNYGVEKTMHEAVHRRNGIRDNKLVLFGTLTMQAKNRDFDGLEKDTITHATLIENRGKVARDWQELPDTQLEYARVKGGSVIAVGGGAVVSNMIQRAHNLGNIDLHIMDGPFGASTDCSRSLEGNGYSFKTTTELIQRLYKRNPEMFIDDFSMDKIEEYIMQAELEVGLTPENMVEISDVIYDTQEQILDDFKNKATTTPKEK